MKLYVRSNIGFDVLNRYRKIKSEKDGIRFEADLMDWNNLNRQLSLDFDYGDSDDVEDNPYIFYNFDEALNVIESLFEEYVKTGECRSAVLFVYDEQFGPDSYERADDLLADVFQFESDENGNMGCMECI